MKDVRERLAMTIVMLKMKKMANGRWDGGMSIMNKFGWSKDRISRFQDSPLDFVQATVNEGQRRGMSQLRLVR